MSEAHVTRLEKAYSVKLPDRYRRFLSSKEYDKLPLLKLEDGYVRGTFKLLFDETVLTDIVELGETHNIDDIDDVDWPGEFGDFVPFAEMFDFHEDGDDPEDSVVRAFLVVSVTEPTCPVLLWDYDGWSLYPVSATLDDFVAGRAANKAPAWKHDRLKTAFKKLSWITPADAEAEADAGEDGDD